MPTLLAGGDPICKVQIAFRPKSRVTFIKEVSIVCYRGEEKKKQKTKQPKSQTRPAEQAEVFMQKLHIFIEHWTWTQLPKSELIQKKAALENTEVILYR